jgi:4-oxalocrotonate tautomerase
VPLVNVKVVRGVMSASEKQQLIQRLADVVVEVFARDDESFRPNVWVVLDEVEGEHWGVGGQPVDPAAVRKLTGRG